MIKMKIGASIFVVMWAIFATATLLIAKIVFDKESKKNLYMVKL